MLALSNIKIKDGYFQIHKRRRHTTVKLVRCCCVQPTGHEGDGGGGGDVDDATDAGRCTRSLPRKIDRINRRDFKSEKIRPINQPFNFSRYLN